MATDCVPLERYPTMRALCLDFVSLPLSPVLAEPSRCTDFKLWYYCPLSSRASPVLNAKVVYSDSLLQQIRYDWWTRYSSPHPEEVAAVDQAWDAIVPAHGIVAVDRAWAATRGFPDSLSWPSDESKGVYIIDAYHQLHCLVRASSLSRSTGLTIRPE